MTTAEIGVFLIRPYVVTRVSFASGDYDRESTGEERRPLRNESFALSFSQIIVGLDL